MAELRWTEESERWLRDIYDYIASENPDAAARVVAGIYERREVSYLMKFENIANLIDGNGQITLGRIGPVHCAATATASDGANCLAMLVQNPNESLMALLARLDQAIEDAVELDIFVDEING
ncbi:MAG: type II toxin-antitoxin system RelE/ParE family toxin [Rhodothermia bacterium]